MISIIVVSIRPALLNQLKQNVAETIGVPYEFVVIDNINNKYGICEAYNLGASRSKYQYLCFAHEDILFHTNGWGKILVGLLNNEEIGLVGVAGSVYKSKLPSAWPFIYNEYYRANVIATGNNEIRKYNPNKEKYSEVAVLDGLFLATNKDSWRQILFNETILKGFNLYDIDFSLRQSKKKIVSHEILIEHFSEGNFGKDWLKESINYHRDYVKDSVAVCEITNRTKKKLDLFAAQTIFKIMINKKFSLIDAGKILFKAFAIDALDNFNWRLLLTFLKAIFTYSWHYLK